MAKPVTRAELRKELSRHPTKDYLRKQLAKYATREELHEELAKYATKQDLEAWGHALFDSLYRKLSQKLETELHTQLAHFAKVIEEANRKYFVALDDKYKDLPERVAKLEARND